MKTSFPAEIIFLLERHFQDDFMDGFWSLVDANDYQEMLESAYVPFSTPSYCFAKDALGSLYVWEHDSIKLVNVSKGVSEIIGRKPSVFFDLKMTDKGFLEKRLNINTFYEAKNELGALEHDECYGYEPVLAAGGFEQVGNMQRVRIREYIAISTQFAGKIE